MAQAPAAIAGAELSDLARDLFNDLLAQLADLDRRLKKLDGQLLSICRSNDACRRLADLLGVGPVIATALVSAVDDGRHFRSGRELAAWIGLTPRQYTTGGKPRLGGIGRRANHYLRRQMIHGARAVMCRLAKHNDRRSQWLKELAAIRTARSRTSGENLFLVCLVMAELSQKLEPPKIPGRFSLQVYDPPVASTLPELADVPAQSRGGDRCD